jgi:DNA-directed RNA polymerase specialized sigma24 family protein
MLRRIADGDSAAAAWLYDGFAPALLRRLARRYPELDAEELLHDSFVLCLRDGGALIARALEAQLAGPVEAADLERWLWDLACGLASNRRRRAAVRLAGAFPADPPAAAAPDPEREGIARDALRQLDRCLAGKGGRPYLYFKLRYADGLSPEEIARATGWSRKATYKLKQSLDEALRECIDRLGLRRDGSS